MSLVTHTRVPISDRIRALGPWFHNLRIDGVETAPDHFLGDYPGVFFRRFERALPASLQGWSVLDVGCNAGFYAFEMERRGASRVLAVDSDERYLSQARFAARRLGSNVEFKRQSVYDLGAHRDK